MKHPDLFQREPTVSVSMSPSALRSRARRAKKAAIEGRSVRPYGVGVDKSERKRLARIQGKPGYKAVKHQSHVDAWRAYTNSPEEIARRRSSVASAGQHSAHVTAWKKAKPGAAWSNRYMNDPEFNAREKVRARLRKLAAVDGDVSRLMAGNVKADRWPRAWCDLLGYGIKELVDHLRLTLPPRATWQQFMSGRLHIDHIVPRSAFDLTRADEVRACWALSNLRLIHARDNLSKGAKRMTLL